MWAPEWVIELVEEVERERGGVGAQSEMWYYVKIVFAKVATWGISFCDGIFTLFWYSTNVFIAKIQLSLFNLCNLIFAWKNIQLKMKFAKVIWFGKLHSNISLPLSPVVILLFCCFNVDIEVISLYYPPCPTRDQKIKLWRARARVCARTCAYLWKYLIFEPVPGHYVMLFNYVV